MASCSQEHEGSKGHAELQERISSKWQDPWISYQMHLVYNNWTVLNVVCLPFCRTLQMMSARRIRWTICSFISINFPLLPMVKNLFKRSHVMLESVWGCEWWHTDALYRLPQMSTSNRFSRNGKMTTRDWRESTRTSSGMYNWWCVLFLLSTCFMP